VLRETSRKATRGQVALFLGGILLLILFFETPYDRLAHQFVTAHMVQHLLITLVVPPMLLLGTPGWLIESWFKEPRTLAWGRWLTSPLIAFALFNVPFSLVHLPVLYELMVRNPLVHLLSHGVFMTTALLLWWPVVGPLPSLPRLSYPLQMLYLLAQTVPGQIIGALLTFSPGLLYPFYAEVQQAGSMSPQADQQFAGLLMWVVGGLLYFIPLSAVFFSWFYSEEKRAAAA
jgi:putative membrane protein